MQTIINTIWFTVKMVLAMGCLLIFQIVYNQEGMLYHPDEPVKYPHLMKQGFQDPAQSGLDFKNVTLETEDGVKIWGWFMFGNSAEKFTKNTYTPKYTN